MSTQYYLMSVNNNNNDAIAVRIEGTDDVEPLFLAENKALVVPLANETLGRSDIRSLGGMTCSWETRGHPQVVVPSHIQAQFKKYTGHKHGKGLWKTPLIEPELPMIMDSVLDLIYPEEDSNTLGMQRHAPPRELPDGGLIYAGWTYRRPVKQVTAVGDHDHSKCRVREEKGGLLWFCAAMYQRWTEDGWADQHVWEIENKKKNINKKENKNKKELFYFLAFGRRRQHHAAAEAADLALRVYLALFEHFFAHLGLVVVVVRVEVGVGAVRDEG